MVSLRPPSDEESQRRKRVTDYDAPCPHEPDCFEWDSAEGTVPVCQMGDNHLTNAYNKLMSEAGAMYGGPYPSGDGAIDAYEHALGSYEDAVEAMLREIKLRGF